MQECVNLAFLGTVNGRPRRSITTLAPHLKLIESQGNGGTRVELYNLRADAAEQDDLASSNKVVAEGLVARLDGIMASAAGRVVAGTTAEMDNEMRAHLRSLGYLQ
jgi:hypothetical protein